MTARKRMKKRSTSKKFDPEYFKGNAIVPMYWLCAYAYEVANYELMSDSDFDRLCIQLDEHWDDIGHPHKDLIDRETLSASTTFHIEWIDVPARIKNSAWSLIDKRKTEEADLLG